MLFIKENVVRSTSCRNPKQARHCGDLRNEPQFLLSRSSHLMAKKGHHLRRSRQLSGPEVAKASITI